MATDREQKYVLTAEDKTKAAFDSLAKSLATTQGLMAKIGVTLSVGAFAAFVKHAIDAADEMGKLSQKLGISTEALSALKFAGDLSNVSMDALTTGLGKLSNTMLKAATGGKEQASILEALGVDMTALRAGTLTLDQAFAQIAIRTGNMRDGWQKVSLLQQALGKGAKDLIPLLNDNADGFKAVTEEAAKFGAIISKDLADKAEAFNDNLTRMNALLRGVALNGANDLIPTLNEIAKAFLDLSSEQKTTGFWKAIGEGLRLAATAAGSLWLALDDIADAMGALMAKMEAFARMEISVIEAIKGAKWSDSIFDVIKKMEAAGKTELDKIAAIGAARDEQYKKNEARFKAFQAQLLAHSTIFGDGTPEQPTNNKKPRTALPDLEDLKIQKSELQKFLDELERETQKLDNKFDPITKQVQDKWLKVFQIAREAGVSLESMGQKAAPFIDAYEDALRAAIAETRLFEEETRRAQDRLSDWESSKAIIESLRDSVKLLKIDTSVAAFGGTRGSSTKFLEIGRQDMEITRQSMTLTGEARATFIKAAKDQQLAWANAFDENYRVTRSFAVGFKTTMSEIYEDATNSAQQTHDLFTNAFRGMEDALVDFVKTGKLNFHSLADSIITDLIRIQVQRLVTAPLAGYLGIALGGIGGAAGGSGAAASFTAGAGAIPGLAGGGDVSAGMPYWVGEHGPELVVPRANGTVVPNGKAAGVNPTWNIYVDSRTDRAEVVELVTKAVQRGNADLTEQLARAGAI